jgi:hypothetical protein
MSRSWALDYLQDYPFWLVDVAPIGLRALPIFNPFMGFSSISGPEITMDVETIKEGNWIFDKKVVTGASVGPITLQRGVTWFDSDFWHWTMATLKGDPEEFTAGIVPGLRTGGVTPRRTMMLIHFFSRVLGDPLSDSGAKGRAARTLITSTGVTAGSGILSGASTGGLVTALGAGFGLFGLNFEFAPRVPAKVYMLYGCLPSRYKLDSDLDATSANVSIQELEMQVEMVEHKTFEF